MKRSVSLLTCLILCISICGCKRDKDTNTQSYYDLFDTVTVLRADDLDRDAFQDMCDLLYSTLLQLHRMLDVYHTYDGVVNLATLNASAAQAPIAVSDMMFDFLSQAKALHEITQGYTNIAMGSVLLHWQESAKSASINEAAAVLPSIEALTTAAQHTDIRALVLNENARTVFFSDPLLRLDAGAIGKGFAADYAVSVLKQNGYHNFVLSLGGNVYACGMREGDRAWRTGIENPQDLSAVLYTLSLKDQTLVTSGSYQRYFMKDGIRYHHIIDPKTLMPKNHFLSVSVLSDNSALADALSTALFSMDRESGARLIASLPNCEALWVSDSGEHYLSDGFSDYIMN